MSKRMLEAQATAGQERFRAGGHFLDASIGTGNVYFARFVNISLRVRGHVAELPAGRALGADTQRKWDIQRSCSTFSERHKTTDLSGVCQPCVRGQALLSH